MKFKLFLSLIFLNSALAIEGVVIVLETPLFSKRSVHSKIFQHVRKNDSIFVHDSHKGFAPFDQHYKKQSINRSYNDEVDDVMLDPIDISLDQSDSFVEKIRVEKEPYKFNGQIYVDQDPLFYRTIDKIGRTAYVLKKHVKLIYKDSREFEMSAKPYDYDEMDYRIEEPLPDRYPLYTKKDFRTSIAFGIGPERKSNYHYDALVEQEKFSARTGLEGQVLRRATFDPTGRYYFGVHTHFYRQISSFGWNSSQVNTNEYSKNFSMGPYLTFDAYRTQKWLVTFGGGINYSYYSTSVISQGGPGRTSNRKFTGFTISPQFSSLIHRKKVIFDTGFFVKLNMSLNLPFTLTSSDPIEDDLLWNKVQDEINYKLGGEIILSVGAMSPF